MRRLRVAAAYWVVIAIGAFTISLRALLHRQVWLFLPIDLAVFISPFAFLTFLTLANRIDRHRYNHIVEAHPLLARFIWQPDLGPRPVGGYRRRCFRRCCFLRSL